MSKVKLNKRNADALVPQDGQVFLWDSDVSGFGIRCRSNGRKYFVLKYRFENRQRWITIGGYGSPWTVETARTAARKFLGDIASGTDPAAKRDFLRSAETMTELCHIYMENYAKRHKKPNSWKSDAANIRNHVIPLLGHINVHAVSRNDIERLKCAVADGKTSVNRKAKKRVRLRVTGGMGAANRCLALLSKMFNLAEEWGLRDQQTNPVRGIKKFKENKIERYLSDEEIATLGTVLNDAVQNDLADATSVNAIKLLMFSGCRLSEVLTLKWDHVDFQRRCLRLSDSKTGAKTVYLPEIALTLLSELPRELYSDYVFAGPGVEGHIIDLRKPWHRIRAEAGLDDVRLHDLRHSFASIAAGEGMSLHIIGKLLGHTQAITTQRYAHLAANPMQEAAEKIGSRLSALMG